MAPYKATLLEVVQRFSDGGPRLEIVQGLVEYRAELRKAGIYSGFQWIDGSFVEDVEKNRGRPPNDVDTITFAYRPPAYSNPTQWGAFIASRKDLFLPGECKKRFRCDAYYVDLNSRPDVLVNQTKYWFGLFSHQRDSFLWKGMLEIALDDDKDVIAFLSRGGTNAS